MIQGWKLAGSQSAKAPKNLAGLLEIGIYFNYLYRFGLLKFLPANNVLVESEH
jgi:hypothetical protein